MNDKQYILDYLGYLKELSRKIGVGVDFGNLVKSKPRNKNLENTFFYFDKNLDIGEIYRIDIGEIYRANKEVDGKLYWYLRQKLIEINNSNQAIFLGIGLLKYVIKENGSYTNKAFGPIFIVNLDIEEDKEGKSISIYFENSYINYDLFNNISENLEDNENSIQLEQAVYFIKTLEEKLEETNNLLGLKTLAKEAILKIPEAFNIKIEQDITIENKNVKEIFYKKESVYLDRNYFFVNNFPSELSTYKSLELLIQEINEEGDFKNSTLKKLFVSAFEEKINLEKVDNFKLEDYEYLTPLQLSESQKKALENAINYEISYIQGPPGTGKSHTITALALLSILLDKKILIVSQKPPAIKVLFEKLTEILEKNNIIPFIYYYDEHKRKMKENVGAVERLNIKDDLKERLRYLEERAIDYINELKELEKNYKKYLALENKYYSIRKDLNDEVKFFEGGFFNIKNYLNHLKCIEIEELNLHKNTFKVLEGYGNTRLLQLRKVFLYRFLKNYHKELELKKFLNISQSLFLDSLIKIIYDYNKIQDTKSKILSFGDIQNLVNRINHIKSQLMQVSKELVNLKLLLKIYENAQKYKNNLAKFKNVFHWVKDRLLKNVQEKVNYENILEIFNIWIVDIPNVDRILPMKPNLFDIVVVDESSQVNLAQIIPVFYRGKHICVVGDHKQLSLEATGLGFSIGGKLDRYTWEKFKPNKIDYEQAKRRDLILTKSSILDFLVSDDSDKDSNRESFNYISAEAQSMLNEHFRSVYPSASFTSKKFYENKIYIMTKNPNLEDKAFKSIKVNGKRHLKFNVVEEEIDEVFKIIESLKRNRRYEDVVLPDYVPENFSIGVLSFTRDQVVRLKIRSYEYGYEDILIGTPEEFQGHEKDVMIISLALDETCTRSKNHYENKNRFNVATSRAKYFTFLVYGGIPENFHLTKEYIVHFESIENVDRKNIDTENAHLDKSKFESELEEFVYNYLKDIVNEINKNYHSDIRIYNQYETCGYRLDFVLHNRKNKKFIALEADGPYHYEQSGLQSINYADWHIERAERLKRAGWKVIHTPYYRWYINGWLDSSNPIMREELERIKKELVENLTT
ncbi:MULTISPECIES: AAA domain-containing protein [unclassified Hydrogenobaculum]|uniref:AAA domain-containing protein n=1 Tax=unclassified Hydrogenobaculum TaxID=2622382 RepID=UPI0001C51C0B|nr:MULTISPECIES: AAA domain-containing protein [unclassified Hydrogenobaculum]AEF19482.1 RAP domain protein [Hydrogenobaculum sp. 3684]AEG46770.1 RAP domain protein [Hydrogenobaculum sp. SHO]AGG15415.1 RAP domain protein [Hydrogenobaculum sp. HO]AGH93717.1 RAP domain-containing protein [Hydrogenobaculum sp. SN]